MCQTVGNKARSAWRSEAPNSCADVGVVKLHSHVGVCRPAVRKNSRQTCPCLPGSSAEESPSLLSSSADRLTQPTPPRPFVEFTLRPAECSDWRDLNCSRLKRTPDSTRSGLAFVRACTHCVQMLLRLTVASTASPLNSAPRGQRAEQGNLATVRSMDIVTPLVPDRIDCAHGGCSTNGLM